MWQPASPTEPVGDGTTPASASTRQRAASTKQKNPGRRVAQIVRLKRQRVDEYKACHAKVWPEVLKQIKDCNIEDYSIFYDDETGILFASFKYVGYDFAGDMDRMRANPKVRDWWRLTDGMQESLVEGATSSEAGEPSWWKPVEEFFYLP